MWAEPQSSVELILEDHGGQRSIPMALDPTGMYQARVEGVGPGSRYWFKIDGRGPFPDPASRSQPLGVHGPSQVVSSESFCWQDEAFRPARLQESAVYELHVGTFTREGTFTAIVEKLDLLQSLGIVVMELMPIADFAGERNWGYDGVALYAPARCYGTPDDLRTLVQEAHRRGIAVCLDVVFNHLGPDGAYHSTFAPKFYSGKHKTLWGDGLNFDGDAREKVRTYFIECAMAWLRDYHIDGFRVDATHAIQDDSAPHFLAELNDRVRALARQLGRQVFLIAEDERNERKMVLPREQGGYGFDAVWSDDFHHGLRRRLAGDSDGYYRDFDGSSRSLARTIQQGWLFCGEMSRHTGKPRGTPADGLPPETRVFCIQNHDQIGNRAFGTRLSSQISMAAYRAATALLLLSPEIPLLFMGQEWAAPEPFLFFTDHHPELGRLVTEGRRKEFEHFASFQDPAKREQIPDPQAAETFLRSKLDWSQRELPGHTHCWNWYRKLLHMRKHLVRKFRFHSSKAVNDQALELIWSSPKGNLVGIVALEGPFDLRVTKHRNLELLLSSEGPDYAAEMKPHLWNGDTGALTMSRAGAILLATAGLTAGWSDGE